MVPAPDETQKSCTPRDRARTLSAGKVLSFAHGFTSASQIVPPADVDVVMICAEGSWTHPCRWEYQERPGFSHCSPISTQDATGQASGLGMAYAKAIGAPAPASLKPSFRKKPKTDLFGEQAVLCGGLSELVESRLRKPWWEAGYQPELATSNCLHEVKLIVI